MVLISGISPDDRKPRDGVKASDREKMAQLEAVQQGQEEATSFCR